MPSSLACIQEADSPRLTQSQFEDRILLKEILGQGEFAKVRLGVERQTGKQVNPIRF